MSERSPQPRSARRRRPPVKRDSILFVLGVGLVVYQQATGRVSIPLLLFAAACTLAPATLRLIGPIMTSLATILGGTSGSSPPSPSAGSDTSGSSPPGS